MCTNQIAHEEISVEDLLHLHRKYVLTANGDIRFKLVLQTASNHMSVKDTAGNLKSSSK